MRVVLEILDGEIPAISPKRFLKKLLGFRMASYDTLDNITLSSKTTYNLTKGNFAFEPISANNIICSINGVVQSGNFSINGSLITFFDVTFSSADKMDYILHVRTVR